MGPKMRGIGWRGLDTRELWFDDVWVPDEHLVGDPALGLGQFLGALEVGRISIAALSLSLTQAVLDLATGYATAAGAVRPADLEVPGGAVQARRHRHRARGGALAHLPGRLAARRGAAVPEGGGDGQAEGEPAGGLGGVGGGPDPRRRGLHARLPSPASTATPRCSRSARAPTRSSTWSSPAPWAASERAPSRMRSDAPVRRRRGGGWRRRCRRGRGARPLRARARRAAGSRRRRRARSGASRFQKPSRATVAAISAPMPNGSTASWAMSSRLVLSTDASIRRHVERGDGAQVDHLDRDAVGRHFGRGRKASCTMRDTDTSVMSSPGRTTVALPMGRTWSAGGWGPLKP